MKMEAGVYVKNSIEAVEFYQKVFGLTLGESYKLPDGNYMHAPLLKNGVELFSVCEMQNDDMVELMLKSSLQSRPTMSYGIRFDNAEEAKKAYEMLIEGGAVLFPLGPLPWSECAADVVDKFGVYWYLTV